MSTKVRTLVTILTFSLALLFSQTVLAAPEHPGAQYIISAEELNELRTANDVRIFDLQHSDHYSAKHIPGANHLDVNLLIDTERFDYEFGGIENAVKVFSEAGIGPDHTVVLYWGNRSDTTYTFWILDYLGHSDVRVLDGGIDAWETAGYELEQGSSPAYPATTFVADVHPDRYASIEWVKEHLQNEAFDFAEARGAAAFERARLPAKNIFHAPASAFFTGDNNVLTDPDSVRQIIAETGLSSDRNIVAYCGRGRAASQLYWVLKVAGYENVRNFEASMTGWTANRLPIVSGR